jgi:hypothetical protein
VAEVGPYRPTLRQRLVDSTTSALKKAGYSDSEARGAAERASQVFGGIFDVQEGGLSAQEGAQELSQGNIGKGLLDVSLGALQAAAGAIPFVSRPASAAVKAVKAVKAARPSKAENEAAGLYHPISETKLKKPISEIQYVREENLQRPLSQRQYISPESLQGGYAIPFVGDRAITSQILRQVEKNPLSAPVSLEGGPNYMRANVEGGAGKSGIWASGPGVVSRLAGVAREGMEKGGPVYGVYSAMSPTSLGFNTMLTEALLNQIDTKNLSKKSIKEFNDSIRGAKGGIGKNFVGIESPLARDQLLNNNPATGNLRTLFTEIMAKEKIQKLGFPDVAATRVAITEPELLNVPTGSSGFTIGKFSENLDITNQPKFPHATYTTQLRGDYLGGTEKPIPYEIMFPDFYASRRAAGIDPSGDWRSFSLSNVGQPLNQEWLDKVMRYLESSK